MALDIQRITGAGTLPELYAALRDAGILDPGARFVHLEMDITSRCNIRCVMCYHSLDQFARSKAVLFPVETFERLAETILPHAHTPSPYFVPILRAAAARGVPNLTFFTNGTLLTDATIAAILETHVTEICVSLDGATAPTYEAIRRGACFEEVIGNVRRLIAARAARGRPEPRVRFDMVLMKRNIHELPSLVELAASLGVDAVNCFHMVVYDGLRTGEQSLARHQDLSDLWLERAIALAAALGVPIASHPLTFAVQS